MQQTIDPQSVPGWGVDADDKNEPTYPMKKYTGDDHNRLNYERPQQQPVRREILHSNERPTVSAVFGDTIVPSGLSGVLRRKAFTYSEGHYFHWLLLMMADRIQVVEGIVNDVAHGKIPNIFAEKGGKAQWKYNRPEAMKKLVFTTAFAVTAFLIFRSRRNSRRRLA